jgi:hypothetical protein
VHEPDPVATPNDGLGASQSEILSYRTSMN